MEIPIGEIISATGCKGLSRNKAIEILNNNDAYNGKVKDTFRKGTVVEGDLDTIVAYIREQFEQMELSSAETERGWMDEKDIIRSDIKSKKERLSIGEQYYEYKTVVVQDSAVLGKTDVEMIDLTLNKYAVEGWRLKAAITNEMGHNRAVVVNATINNTILIFERLVTKE